MNILAIGAHPDDVELACGGTVLSQIAAGHAVSILDLTEGELGTRGNATIRKQEARAAADILGVEERMNLSFRDGFFSVDEAHILKLVEVIRFKKPDVILCNSVQDRHPDHGKAANLVEKACFYSGLVKVETTYQGKKQEKWRPRAVYNYIQFRYLKPDFIVDISDHYDKKMLAIMAFKSQFYDPNSSEPESLISSKEFLDSQNARMKEYGHAIGCTYGEGFNVQRVPGISDLKNLL